jgi:hypothetical protein
VNKQATWPSCQNDLQKVSLAPAENVEIASVRIALQRLLHENRKRAEAFSHVGAAGRQPDLNAARKCDHLSVSFARSGRGSRPTSAPITLASVVSSGEPSIVTRIRAEGYRDRRPRRRRLQLRRRGSHRHSKESGKIARRRQLLPPSIQQASINAGLPGDSVAFAPGSIKAATHPSFAERDH